MRFHEKIKAALLAARIECHWRRIHRLRKLGNKLLTHGNTLNSKRLLSINRRLDRWGLRAAQQEKYYETHYVPPIGKCACKI